MKILVQCSVCCLLASGAFAQHHGGGGHGGSAGGGMGHGGFVRGGAGHGGFNGVIRGGGFGGRDFGRRGFRDRDDFFGRRLFGFYGGYYWPWLSDYGLWDSPYYGYSDAAAYSYQAGPNVTVVYPPPPAYPVAVEQPAHPVVREYRQPEDYGLPAERESRPVIYLIAFRDHAIHAAMTYWAEGGTLHYLDMDHKEKQAPLSSVDEAFSAQLNRERHVPFRLPAP